LKKKQSGFFLIKRVLENRNDFFSSVAMRSPPLFHKCLKLAAEFIDHRPNRTETLPRSTKRCALNGIAEPENGIDGFLLCPAGEQFAKQMLDRSEPSRHGVHCPQDSCA
jgi:hypothetical protein